MIYELRTYDAFPGKLPALNARFANVTLGFFEKYNMKVVGFWTNNVGENTTNRYSLGLLSFMCRHSLGGRDPSQLQVH